MGNLQPKIPFIPYLELDYDNEDNIFFNFDEGYIESNSAEKKCKYF